MKLSHRLSYVASLIDCDRYVIDVGCDHALLDIYLTKEKHCQCLATDISKKCILRATENVAAAGLSDSIVLRVQDGILEDDLTRSSVVVMLGMGNSTILSILKRISHHGIDQLIVQSNQDAIELRKKIVKYGYYIADEQVIYEKKQYYPILVFRKGKRYMTLYDQVLGPILRTKDFAFKIEYYQYIFEKYARQIKQIPYLMTRRKGELLLYQMIIKSMQKHPTQ